MKHKIIFFDWNKTLSNSLFWEHLADSKLKNSVYLDKIEKSLFIQNRYLINDWMRGNCNKKEVINILSETSGVAVDIILKELKKSCEDMKFASEEILPLIQEIRKSGIKTVIATDNMDTFREFTIPSMNLEESFDDFLVSYDLGLLKYDTLDDSIPFFDSYLRKESLSYNDVVLLDDSLDNTGVYNKLGFEIVEITSPEILVEVLRSYVV